MDFYRIHGKDGASGPGYKGFREAFGGLSQSGDGESVILVPGAVFDRRGIPNWIRRQDYYDRYLAVHKNVKTLAAAYPFQIVEEVIREEWDRPVERIFTAVEEIVSMEFL